MKAFTIASTPSCSVCPGETKWHDWELVDYRAPSVRIVVASKGWKGEQLKEIRSSWKKACRLASIRDFRLHDLRLICCTNPLESGADLADVMEIIGHSSLRMARRYTHVTNKRKQRLQNGLEQYYQANSI